MPALGAIKCPDCGEPPVYLYKRKTDPTTNQHKGYEFFGFWCEKCKKIFENKLVEIQ